jgi:hypothetical protein
MLVVESRLRQLNISARGFVEPMTKTTKAKTPIMTPDAERFMAFEGLIQWTQAVVTQSAKVSAARDRQHRSAIVAQDNVVGLPEAMPIQALSSARLENVGQVPDADAGVPTSRGEAGAVGRKRDGIDSARMSLQLAQKLARGRVPDADGLVVAASRGEAGAVGRKRDGIDSARLSLQLAQKPARGRVPDADAGVPTSRGEAGAVGQNATE